MTRRKNIAIFWILSIVITVLSSCNKSERGCTDRDSENYEPEATKDCSCCYYIGKGLIFYKSDYYNNRINGGRIFLMKYYVDGTLEGYVTELENSVFEPVSSSSYGLYTPEYDDNYILFNLGNLRQKTFLVTITDQSDVILYSKQVNIVANKITLLNL